MQDIPYFETDHGLAGLVLNQIPYTHTAFIHLLDITDPALVLKECVQFCVACGADAVYASGHTELEKYPLHMRVLEMTAALDAVEDTDACLMPVTEQTLDQWCQIYHERMAEVDHAAHISEQEGKRLLMEGCCYFVHRDGRLLGIGKAKGSAIDCLAAVAPGAGATVVQALCRALTDESVSIEVASTNHRAIRLYERLGFLTTRIKHSWYRVR